VASLVSALLGDYIEAGAILAIVILNATLGVVQERRAEAAMAALKRMAAPEAQVLRDGRRISVPASQLVPGDLVFLEAGNYIPADVRLVEAINLRLEEAALTGESLPVQKNAAVVLEADIPLGDQKNAAFMGTVVSYGRGHGVVTATGMNTQLGMIATMLQTVKQENTPLQARLDNLGKQLGWATLAICAVVFVLGIIRSNGSLQEIVSLFMIAVSLSIAAVPEGLPAVVTISLALGMREMVKRHALIRRLSSVETLGSTTVICSDKTGTLTQNEMSVTRVWVDGREYTVSGSGYNPEGEFMLDGQPVDMKAHPAAMTTLWVGVLNNDARLEETGSSDGQATYRIVGDPTEGSILVAAIKAGALPDSVLHAYPRTDEIPFDSVRKRMVTVHSIKDLNPEDISPVNDIEKSEWMAVAVKGAPDVVLELCNQYQGLDDEPHPMDEATRQRILRANDTMSYEALRVLGLAYRLTPEIPSTQPGAPIENDLVFAGLIGMIDPPRQEAGQALEKARRAGIRTVMITGDYANTARAIAENIGLLRPGRQLMTGAELNQIDDAAMLDVVKVTDVYARVSPEHKMRIVDALRSQGEVVAMTGDGVNDAPAIKMADIGIAMGITGTDVAKESADMVLTDDNYASIVSAVEQGRIIYTNIRKFVFFILSSNMAEVLIIFLAILAGLPSPLTAIQLLWLNLLTDGAPALALALEKGDADAMLRPPRPKNEPIINGTMTTGIVIQTVIQTAVVLTAFCLGLIWYLQEQGIPGGASSLLTLFQYNWVGINVQSAETMAFLTLSFCELFRAYTVRTERQSIFKLGVFSNPYMQAAVGFSIVLLLLVVCVPFLQPVFNTHLPTLKEWAFVLGLALVPALAEEITKIALRLRSSTSQS
jgi:Ca2+-transporting ATPase